MVLILTAAGVPPLSRGCASTAGSQSAACSAARRSSRAGPSGRAPERVDWSGAVGTDRLELPRRSNDLPCLGGWRRREQPRRPKARADARVRTLIARCARSDPSCAAARRGRSVVGASTAAAGLCGSGLQRPPCRRRGTPPPSLRGARALGSWTGLPCAGCALRMRGGGAAAAARREPRRAYGRRAGAAGRPRRAPALCPPTASGGPPLQPPARLALPPRLGSRHPHGR